MGLESIHIVTQNMYSYAILYIYLWAYGVINADVIVLFCKLEYILK